jgi:hypothetical protein
MFVIEYFRSQNREEYETKYKANILTITVNVCVVRRRSDTVNGFCYLKGSLFLFLTSHDFMGLLIC